jgi:hypothetical protein
MTTSAEYVEKVKVEHKAVCEGESSMLAHAITCGKLLATVEHILKEENATKTRKKDHVTLNEWANRNCGIAQTTVSLYKRLWENEAEIKKKGCKSIGEAKRDALPKDPNKVKAAEERKAAREQKKQEDEQQAVAQGVVHLNAQDLLNMLDNLGWTPRKFHELFELLEKRVKTPAASTTRANQPAVAAPDSRYPMPGLGSQ